MMIHILIVDDDEAVRATALRCLAGPDVVLASAADGRLGLEQALRQPPDLIVCDVDMPNMDGFELLAALRERPEFARTQVMMLTAQGSRDAVRLGMTLGADDYLVKPFSDDELRGAVDALSRKRGRMAAVVEDAVRNQEEQLRRAFGRAFDGSGEPPSDFAALEATREMPAEPRNVVEAAVLFSDIRGFTSLSEKLTAAEVAVLLTEYFERVCEPVLAHGGHYLKMMGDGLMAVFTDDPAEIATPERRAVDAALAMSGIAARFADWVESSFPRRGLPRLATGFGLHRGELAISRMGSHNDKVATPIGDTVNVAARLESASKDLGWTIVASRAVADRAGDIAIGASASIHVRGKTQPIPVVEVLALVLQDPVAGLHTRTISLGVGGRGAGAPASARPMPVGAELTTLSSAETVAGSHLHSRLRIDLQENARLAGRAVKEALGARLDALKDHRFDDSQEAPRLAGWRIVRRLGSGGMSSIYLAAREDSGELAVLKVLDAARDAPEQMARFVREYALLATVQHPNIVRIFHQGFSDKHAYIAMEYFENGDLRTRMRQPLAPAHACDAVAEVARALAAIHAVGIVHRDLKPENLMLRADQTLVLADFGIAKSVLPPQQQQEQEQVLTRHGDMIGSPAYMSPEQIAGDDVTARSDLYSLGVLFYELLSGQRPFLGRTLVELLSQHTRAPVPPLPPSLTQLQPLVDRLMAKEPAERYASAEAFLDALAPLRATLDAAPPASGTT